MARAVTTKQVIDLINHLLDPVTLANVRSRLPTDPRALAGELALNRNELGLISETPSRAEVMNALHAKLEQVPRGDQFAAARYVGCATKLIADPARSISERNGTS